MKTYARPLIVAALFIGFVGCGHRSGVFPRRKMDRSAQTEPDEVHDYADQDIATEDFGAAAWHYSQAKASTEGDAVSSGMKGSLTLDFAKKTFVRTETFNDKDGKPTLIRSEAGSVEFEPTKDFLVFRTDIKSADTFMRVINQRLADALNQRIYCGRKNWRIDREKVQMEDTDCAGTWVPADQVHVQKVAEKLLVLEVCTIQKTAGRRTFHCSEMSYVRE